MMLASQIKGIFHKIVLVKIWQSPIELILTSMLYKCNLVLYDAGGSVASSTGPTEKNVCSYFTYSYKNCLVIQKKNEWIPISQNWFCFFDVRHCIRCSKFLF